MGTGRLESFSDGVMAVAITLLVLGIAVPHAGSGHLGHDLVAQWPQYAAYAVSFLTIGIVWVNHHAMVGRLREADHSILILNLALLMTIGLLPFATELMADYLRRPGESLAAAVYAGAFALMGFTFAAMNRQVLLHRAHLLHTELPLAERRRILRLGGAGTLPYLAAIPLAFVSPYITLAICGGLGAYYMLPIAAGAGGAPAG